MTEELVKLTDTQGESHDSVMIADSPVALIGMQTGLLEWSKQKLVAEQAELDDIEKSIEIARKAKWSTASLKTRRVKALDRVSYYGKVQEALEAGYILFPPLSNDIALFAIKVDNGETPDWQIAKTPTYKKLYAISFEGACMDAGEGIYVSDQLPFRHMRNEKDDKGNEVKVWKNPNEYREVHFPLSMVKARVIESASDAMATKIFDALGVSIPPTKKRDPVIIGRIYGEKGAYGSRRYCDFLISWRIDTRSI